MPNANHVSQLHYSSFGVHYSLLFKFSPGGSVDEDLAQESLLLFALGENFYWPQRRQVTEEIKTSALSGNKRFRCAKSPTCDAGIECIYMDNWFRGAAPLQVQNCTVQVLKNWKFKLKMFE
jgi:hypothetical protein